MKRWKKILRNCPYLIVLLITWLFITAGGIGLMIYRGYSGFEWKEFCANPFFAVIMKEEMNNESYNAQMVMAQKGSTDKDNDAEINDAKINEAGNSITIEDEQGNLQGVSVNGSEDDRQGLHGDNAPGSAVDKISSVIQNKTHNNGESVSGNKVDGGEKPGEEMTGKTVFVTYTPVETDSIYYSDAGKLALTTEYPYKKVEADYFDDAIFFGDSRTLGISDYSGMDADFFCENGMTIYKLLDEKGVVNQKTEMKENLNQVLQEKKYGKIYIMLGMNELGYRDTPYFLEQYKAVVEQLRQWQPEAIIYLQANLHVSREKDNPDTEFNNININDKNAAIATLANGTDVFYLDVNPLFTDSDGYLNADLTFDGVHLYADGYMAWRDFLMEHGVVRE